MIYDIDDTIEMVRGACSRHGVRTGTYVKQSVTRLVNLGLSPEELYACVVITSRATHVDREGQWRYFIAVARNKSEQELDGAWADRIIESVA